MRHIAVFDVMPVYGFIGHLLHSITNSSCEGNNFITLTNGKSFSLWQWLQVGEKSQGHLTTNISQVLPRGLGAESSVILLSQLWHGDKGGATVYERDTEWQRMKAAVTKNKPKNENIKTFESQGQPERTRRKAAKSLNATFIL